MQSTFYDIEFQYTEAKNKANFFENEYAKAKAYTETLLEQIANMKLQLNPNFIQQHPDNFLLPFHQTSSPKRIPLKSQKFRNPLNFSAHPENSMEEDRIQYEFRHVTKYVNKTVVIPITAYTKYPNH